MSLEMMALIVIVGIILFLLVLWLLPTEKSRRRRPDAPKIEDPDAQKDWKAACLKMEKHILELRAEVVAFEKKAKLAEKELAVEREKYKKLQEKMSQERGWQKKEEADVEKRAREFQALKENLQRSEAKLEEEHTQRLMLEREAKELRQNFTNESAARKALESEILKLKAQGEVDRKDLLELREINSRMQKKAEDTTFIAKSEYDKLEILLKDREKEITRLKRPTGAA
ncbi:MAG: hypothetical protein Q8Q08_03110 [Candidatus Omnitrophota bacterium]|nr:hypothetical protein [Candidatus Omnitrophota bacterium]MDZ4243065.1 hypothetical protein [Candidatus Omnitrophota bacterium]